jgi:hypothetical protein
MVMKKKLVIYGNCQVVGIETVLNAIPAFVDEFEIVRHDLWLADEALANSLSDYETCDILLLQHVSNWKEHPMRDRIAPSVQIVRFPFLIMGALWPCDGFEHGADFGWSYAEPSRRYGYQDAYLGKLRTLVPDPEERFRVYTDFTFPDAPDIKRYAAFVEARLLKGDREIGSTLGRFVVDNYRHTRLFHTITHPSGLLMQKLAEDVLTQLGLDPAAVASVNMDMHSSYQVPIHPKVIETLELTWVDGSATYSFYNEPKTFEEYTMGYIQAYG